ncbi:MAG: tetratricopeptide repeat protein [Spirochaetes bacterium]|jgi:tetratricopeptide (TPR) repeat protein|nr:tetratricopeptide repeat protein [Spirochaetota bacterium]
MSSWEKTIVAVALLTTILAGSLLAQELDALELYREGRYEDAVEATLEEIEAEPRNMNSYTVLGWSLLALGRYEEALEFGLQALEVSRFDSRIIQIVGEANYFLGNNMEALEYLQEYVAISPTGSLIDQVYYYLGEIFIDFGEYHHADIALTAAVYHEDSVASWWSRLGFVREQLEDYEYALQAYDRALELNPSLGSATQGRQRVRAALSG